MVFPLHPASAKRAAAGIIMAAAAGVALSGCITVPTGPAQPTATQGATAPLSYVDRLKATSVVQPTEDAGVQELPQFVTDSRNIACVFTSSRAGNLNQPWEPNNFADGANAAAPSIPVVNCQMVSYPQPLDADQGDNCSGTNVGYLGGVATLFPDKASYGGCRAGVTAVEAAFGTGGNVNQVMASIPVLAPGQAMEAHGYRCAPMDDGVACANLASGTGFFIAAETYKILGADKSVQPQK
ncbi:hypothetical protein [Arthrobacter sp. E3]|uniref:hypothetical protein n=1 Tax=Arthrobacter sp. E3 TaxID=517402 RepID=UPI001A941DDC|nr:hypothetical protein [Arthrobacter sp. E3]